MPQKYPYMGDYSSEAGVDSGSGKRVRGQSPSRGIGEEVRRRTRIQ